MPKSCSIDNCSAKHYSRGWCRKHYTRWQRHGDPLIAKPGGSGVVLAVVSGSAAKVCHRCHESRALEEFGPLKVAPDGLNYWCRACLRDYFRARRRRLGLMKPQIAKVCEECGEGFTTAREGQRFCADYCGHKFHRRKSQQPWNERRRSNYQKRRALKKAAPIGDPVLLAEIRERDRDRCGLCGKRVGNRPWPHPSSPSLDHIVPLSVGGAHDPANVQLAHLRCNISKGNRGGGEQLRMV